MTPNQIATIRLLSLEGIGPARLVWLTEERSSSEVVARLLDGARLASPNAPPGVRSEMVESWRSALRSHVGAASDEQLIDRYGDAGVTVLDATSPAWPFVADPEPPALLFARGDLGLISSTQPMADSPLELGERRPSVAIVGSRRCTSVGRRIAELMGAELAALGVVVVSGLALGIDGEAHRGVFKAQEHLGEPRGGAVGVVASGLDVVYPTRHRDLWRRVGDEGLLLSEAPLGIAPARWRFPARNRLVAALADGVVVVESHERGGALSTVDEAATRDVPVFAVPGSVLSAASDGTNRLLVDGAVPVRNGADVVGALGLVNATDGGPDPAGRESAAQQTLDLDARNLGDESFDSTALDITALDSTALDNTALDSTALDSTALDVSADVLAEVRAGSQSVEQLASDLGLDAVVLLETVQRLALAGRVVVDGNRVRLP